VVSQGFTIKNGPPKKTCVTMRLDYVLIIKSFKEGQKCGFDPFFEERFQ
jgi:hypothetical protein